MLWVSFSNEYSRVHPWYHSGVSVLDTRLHPMSGISPRIEDSCQCPGYPLVPIILKVTLCPEYPVPGLKSTCTFLILAYLQNFWIGECCYSNFPQYLSSTMYSSHTSLTIVWCGFQRRLILLYLVGLGAVPSHCKRSWTYVLTCIASVLTLLHCLLLLFIVCLLPIFVSQILYVICVSWVL